MKKEEGGRRKEEGGRRKEEGGRRKEEGGRRKEEDKGRKDEGDSTPGGFVAPEANPEKTGVDPGWSCLLGSNPRQVCSDLGAFDVEQAAEMVHSGG